jgi:hypothetical protein
MTYNFTIAVLIYTLSTIPIIICFFVMYKEYMKTKYRHLLYFDLAILTSILWSLLQGAAILFMSPFILITSIIILFIGPFPMLLFIDVVSRDAIDSLKMIGYSMLFVLVVAFSFDNDAVSQSILPNGADHLIIGGRFEMAIIVALIYYVVTILIFATKLHYGSPKNLRKYSRILLLAGVLWAIVLPIVIGFGLDRTLLPGLDGIIVAIGLVLVSIAFYKEPKLAYVLSFKALRLMVIKSDSGIPIYTKTWNKSKELANEALFSGIVQGIGLILKESVNQGDVNEIIMDQGVVLINNDPFSPVTSVLVITKSNKIMRQALIKFSALFIAQYSKIFEEGFTGNVSLFSGASEIVDVCFPFVPQFA